MRKGSYKIEKINKGCKTSTVQDVAKNIYLKINELFKNIYNIDLAEALTKVPEVEITKSKTKAQKQKEITVRARQFKIVTEEQRLKVDCDAMLGTCQSYKQRDLERKSLYFESPEEAKTWTNKRKALEEIGLRKAKRHSPDPNSVDFDKEGQIQEIKSMKEGEKVRIMIYSNQY